MPRVDADAERLDLRTWSEVARLYALRHPGDRLSPQRAVQIGRAAERKLRCRLLDERPAPYLEDQ